MKKLITLSAALLLCAPAHAAPAHSRAVDHVYKQGFRDCAGAMDRFVKFNHEDDDGYSYMASWSTDAANGSMANALTVEEYTDARTVTSISAVKDSAGKCDVVMTSTLPFLTESCASLRETSFKAWKYYGDLGGATIYEDPTTPNGSVAMSPLGASGCLVVKQIIGFGVPN